MAGDEVMAEPDATGVLQALQDALDALPSVPERLALINAARALLHAASPLAAHPVDLVRWVHHSEVQANDYNPNSVAGNEMRLLHMSIAHDGYTQPIVVIFDPALGKYVLVDGFHRYSTLKQNPDIQAATCGGYLPAVVLDKPINDRMASTVRHNRARGKHSIKGMANIIFEMLDNGWDDAAICGELGMEADELVRLKHVTGFSKLFENVSYRQAWETRRQIKLRTTYDRGGPEAMLAISAEDSKKLIRKPKAVADESV